MFSILLSTTDVKRLRELSEQPLRLSLASTVSKEMSYSSAPKMATYQ
jgi:hypothetical protein